MSKPAFSKLLLRKIKWKQLHGKDPLILPVTESEYAELNALAGKTVETIYGCTLHVVPDTADQITMDNV